MSNYTNSATGAEHLGEEEHSEDEHPEDGDDRIKCPECGSDSIFEDKERAERICLSCGMVLEVQLIDQGPEWRAFNPTELKERERTHPRYKGDMTKIDQRDTDIYGKKIIPKKRAQVYRMRKWQNRIQYSSSDSRTSTKIKTEIERITGQMILPKHVKEAAYYWEDKRVTKKLLKGQDALAIAAAKFIFHADQDCIRILQEKSLLYQNVQKNKLARCTGVWLIKLK